MVTLTAKQAREKYQLREKEADIFGRIITVRILHPSEQSEVIGLTPNLSGFESVPRADGSHFEMTHRAPWLMAAAVVAINEDGVDKFVTFPRSYAELKSIFDELDTEGIAAVGRALVRLSDKVQPITPPLDEAKNSPGTPISGEPVG